MSLDRLLAYFRLGCPLANSGAVMPPVGLHGRSVVHAESCLEAGKRLEAVKLGGWDAGLRRWVNAPAALARRALNAAAHHAGGGGLPSSPLGPAPTRMPHAIRPGHAAAVV